MGFWETFRAALCCAPTTVRPAEDAGQTAGKDRLQAERPQDGDADGSCLIRGADAANGTELRGDAEPSSRAAQETAMDEPGDAGCSAQMEKGADDDALAEVMPDISQALHGPADCEAGDGPGAAGCAGLVENKCAVAGDGADVCTAGLDVSDEDAGAPVVYDGFFLPPKKDSRPTLVLDLDHTLVYPANTKPDSPCFEVNISYRDKSPSIWVVERPFLQKFLDALHAKFEIVVFTAGIRQYGTKVLRQIDGRGRVAELLDRRHCSVLKEGDKDAVIYVKNLDYLGRDLRRTIIVDDKEYSYIMNFSNGQYIPAFHGDLGDRALLRLQEYLLGCLELGDFTKREFLDYHEPRDGLEAGQSSAAPR